MSASSLIFRKTAENLKTAKIALKFLRMTTIVSLPTYHVFKAKIVMNKQQVSPPRVLAHIRMVSHNLIPQWTRSSPRQDEGTEQNQGNKIWNQSDQTETSFISFLMLYCHY
jgi:hypothetical protein